MISQVDVDLLRSYALILEEVGQVAFQVNDILYRVFQSDDGSWDISIYREDLVSTKVGEVLAFVEIDSSTLVGSSNEAVEFFL